MVLKIALLVIMIQLYPDPHGWESTKDPKWRAQSGELSRDEVSPKKDEDGGDGGNGGRGGGVVGAGLGEALLMILDNVTLLTGVK